MSRAEALEVNKYLQKKAEEFSDVMEETTAGNLTERMATDGENDRWTVSPANQRHGRRTRKDLGQLNSSPTKSRNRRRRSVECGDRP